VIGLSGLRAQDLANKVVPGSGYVLAGLITLGGLVFCIGNLSATGQGLRNLFGLEPRIGVVLSAALAILIFSYKALDGTLDKAVIVLGTIKIGLIAYICVVTTPPVGEAVVRTFAPVGLDFLPVLTLIGGTIGASFTSATFLKTLVPPAARRFNLSISVFIAISTVLYLIVGQAPAALLVFAGAFNGLILPFGLGIMLWIAWRRRDLLQGATYPRWICWSAWRRGCSPSTPGSARWRTCP
jgi:Mn2+/Fe2+ NRAMP family transporter